MEALIIFIHATICVGLVTIILMQSGRGGGLTESFSSAESMFGAQTNAFLIKSTTVMATVFLVTCLGLAIVSTKKNESLMSTKLATQELPSIDEVAGEVENTVGAVTETVAEEVVPFVNEVPTQP